MRIADILQPRRRFVLDRATHEVDHEKAVVEDQVAVCAHASVSAVSELEGMPEDGRTKIEVGNSNASE